jgi:SSS family solute:Na+ symporter
MLLTLLDLSIIGLYLACTIAIGLILKSRASKNLDSYLLGGKTLPWYMLSLSNASGMFDISGTMWLVTLLFLYGLKSIYIPWLWPVFNQVFLMVFLSLWLRRSNVLTGAEWIRTRFGDDRGGRLSHSIVVIFALIGVLGMLAYGFIGVGKFVEIFLPWEVVSPYLPFELDARYAAHFYGIVFTIIATFYVMLGGMMSIVWADLLQFTIMAVSAVIIAVIAMTQVSPELLHAAIPAGWDSPWFGWELNLNWQDKIPEVIEKLNSDGYELFTALVMMMLFKGLLVSAAGPLPNYDMQKILATKSPREAAKMSGFVSVVLMPIRYLMIAGFTVLALVFYHQLDLQNISNDGVTYVDFEKILPSAISQFAPVGIMGLLLAGLIAAFMSTFASTVNAAPGYLVNDIYKRYIRPDASPKTLVRLSYLVSVLVVIISTCIGFMTVSINAILQWVVSGLYGGYTISNVLKWYWWRLNGMGYFAGMVVGLLIALFKPVFELLFPEIPGDILPLYMFPLILVCSGLAAVLTSIYTKPESMERLVSFYRSVRPWGFWGPVHAELIKTQPEFTRNPNFKRDMFNIAVGIILQTSLVALPIFLVIKEFDAFSVCLVLIIAAIFILWKTWYQNLRDWPEQEIEQERASTRT